MSQTQDEIQQKPSLRRFLPLGLGAAALGIAGAIWLGNGSGAVAQECNVDASILEAMDLLATGELAAILPTGSGRGYNNLEYLNEEGQPTTLADFEGKSILVNFWATWCGPCREEMPALDALSAKFGGEEFAVVTINLDVGDDGIDKARAFLEEIGLTNLPLLADPTFAAFERLKNNGVALGLPATLLLDTKGCEVAVLQGPAIWDGPAAFKMIGEFISLTRA